MKFLQRWPWGRCITPEDLLRLLCLLRNRARDFNHLKARLVNTQLCTVTSAHAQWDRAREAEICLCVWQKDDVKRLKDDDAHGL